MRPAEACALMKVDIKVSERKALIRHNYSEAELTGAHETEERILDRLQRSGMGIDSEEHRKSHPIRLLERTL